MKTVYINSSQMREEVLTKSAKKFIIYHKVAQSSFGGRAAMWAQRKKSQQGTVVVMVVVALMALLGMAALSIDVGRLALAKQELQDVADAAALAGCARLRQGFDIDQAQQAAVEIANANTVLGRPLVLDPAVDVQVGGWDPQSQQIVPWSATFTEVAVKVTARRTTDSPGGPIPMIFGKLFGVEHAGLTASGAASVRTSTSPRDVVEIIVVQDASGSFQEEWTEAIEGDWAMVDLINNVSIAGDSVGFVAFNDEIASTGEWHYSYWQGWYWVPGDPLSLELTGLLDDQTETLPLAVNDMHNLVSGYTPSGYTNPAVALNWAIDQLLAGGSESRKVIVLVSDGMPYGSTDAITAQRRQATIDAADRAEAEGIRIHTVTLTAEDEGTYGTGGSDFEFNQSLVRNGGYAFRTHDPQRLCDLMIAVGNIEIGHPRLFL